MKEFFEWLLWIDLIESKRDSSDDENNEASPFGFIIFVGLVILVLDLIFNG